MKLAHKATKLDGRFAGYPWFTHHLTVVVPRGVAFPQYSIVKEFNKIRDWCWATWGPSCELYDYDYLRRAAPIKTDEAYQVNEFWSWYVKDNVRRIYLTEKGKVWFDLAWI